MDQLLLKKRIYQVQPPPETLNQCADEMEIQRSKWGKYFKNSAEFELFAMLPLTDEQRWKVLDAVAQEKKAKDEITHCKGQYNKDAEHRKYCIACCILDPPIRV